MIHERLKALLSALHLSQRQFAGKINLDPGYFSRIMQGKVIPPDRILLLIENVFHVNKTWLETGEGEMFSTQSDSLEKTQLHDMIGTLNDEQVNAVCAFIRYLTEYRQS